MWSLSLVLLLSQLADNPNIALSQVAECPTYSDSTEQLLLSPSEGSGTQDGGLNAKQLPTINLLTMLPFPNPIPQFDPSWNEGNKILPAVYLAMDQINNRTDLLPCHKLELVVVDGGCDIAATTAISSTIGLIGDTKVVGLVGPGCSTSALQTAQLLNRSAINLIQIHGGGSPLLGDRSEYPNSLGLLGSTQSFVDLSLALMKKAGWRNIAILFESNRVYYRSTKEAFVASLNSNVSVLFTSTVYTTFYPLDGVRSSLARIVFVFTAPSHSLRIMCLAYHLGMIYPAYQWVIISRRLSDFVAENASPSDSITFTYSRRTYTCSLGSLLSTALEGTFLLNYQIEPLNINKSKFANTSFEEFLELYNERADSYNVTTTYWSYYFYDSVWAWARVLHQMTINNSNIFNNFHYGNESLTNAMLKEFYARDFEFEGMSGHISFNSSNGFYNRPSNLYQVVGGEKRHVAYNNGTSIIKLQPLEVVPDLVRTESSQIHVALIAVFAIIQFVEFFTTALLHVLTVVNRKEKSVRASSPNLSHFAFAGCYTLLVALQLHSFIEIKVHSDEVSGAVCQTIWGWLLPIGFTLTIGTVTVRTWRLYRIFTHYLNPGKLISNPSLITMMVILLSIDIIVAVVWTSIDPLRLVIIETSVQVGSANELVLDRSCQSQLGFGFQGYAIWIVIIMTIRFTLLIVMVALSVLTRRIPNKSFTTSSLRIFAYIFSGVLVLGFMLYYLLIFLNLDHNIQHFVLQSMLNTCIMLYIGCVFIPPLMPVIQAKVKQVRDNSDWLSTSTWNSTKKEDSDEVHENESIAVRLRKISREKLLY
jgi:gamma-aminobutyric acid type B receptor